MSSELLAKIEQIEKFISQQTDGSTKDYRAEIVFTDGQPIVKVSVFGEKQSNSLEDLEKNPRQPSDLLS